MAVEFVEAALEVVFEFLGLHGFKLGALATILVGVHYASEIASLLIGIARVVRIGSLVLGIVGVLLVVAVATGTLSLNQGALGQLLRAASTLINGVIP